jgi:hypothetical protein
MLTLGHLADCLEALTECIDQMQEVKRQIAPGDERSELLQRLESMSDTRKRVRFLLKTQVAPSNGRCP